jgi:acetate kinase
MDNAILVLNTGSSSIKFGVFVLGKNGQILSVVYRGEISGIGFQPKFVATSIVGDTVNPLSVDESFRLNSHEDALQALFEWLKTQASGLDFIAVGHRVVHGGALFATSIIVDSPVLLKLEQLIPLAPLHQANNLAAIKTLDRIAPLLPQVACFDTAFHHTMPSVAKKFALPRSLTAEDIRPYGFHGLSYEYIASVLPTYQEAKAGDRVVVAHLGHGASLCAMVDGQSVATTMTYTPLDGLPMATRCGSLDPGVLLYLMTEKAMDVSTVSDLLNNKSGLLGMSGISGDMRELLASSDPNAGEAIEHFVYRISRELGAMAATTSGLDALVFTGGIGENSAMIREQVCRRSSWLGIQLDPVANLAGGPLISEKSSPVSVWVIPTNEEFIIAQKAYEVISQN